MAEEIAFENGRISNSEGLVTLTFDWIILHTVMHHQSTSTYMPIFILKSKKLFVDGRTYGLRPVLLGRFRRRVNVIATYELWPGNRTGLFLTKSANK